MIASLYATPKDVVAKARARSRIEHGRGGRSDGRIGSRFRRLEDPPLLTGPGPLCRRHPASRSLCMLPSCAARMRMPLSRASMSRRRARSPVCMRCSTLDDLAPVLARRRMVREPAQGGKAARGFCGPTRSRAGEVAFVGEPIALVVAAATATSPRTRSRWSTSITTFFPPVTDPRDAALAGARTAPARLYVQCGRHVPRRVWRCGRRVPDVPLMSIARSCFSIAARAHPIEARGLVAQYEPARDGVTVWASTQKAHDLYQNLCAFLVIDENRLRVATPDIGGGFGPKLCVYPEDVAVTAAAKLLKRSLKWIEDRREHFVATVQERDQYWSVEIAVDEDCAHSRHTRQAGSRSGRLCAAGREPALQFRLRRDRSLSSCRALAMEVVVAHTNKVPVSSVRGAGYPQAAFAMERLMDRVARELQARSRRSAAAQSHPAGEDAL